MADASVGLSVGKGESAWCNPRATVFIMSSLCKPAAVMTTGAEGERRRRRSAKESACPGHAESSKGGG
ncbi:hypothetical protein CH063_14392 [Colletotrichum higginsianum]|uniref:Uncharacterized protein n=1 Tax=Colletotrichum higginsianum (strain IMI 349063) TaxID=759273 RepID=H1VYD4_COLHI|nr:hypothetical protein CH063_14392 [Colletotrichum higginsianum]